MNWIKYWVKASTLRLIYRSIKEEQIKSNFFLYFYHVESYNDTEQNDEMIEYINPKFNQKYKFCSDNCY